MSFFGGLSLFFLLFLQEEEENDEFLCVVVFRLFLVNTTIKWQSLFFFFGLENDLFRNKMNAVRTILYQEKRPVV